MTTDHFADAQALLDQGPLDPVIGYVSTTRHKAVNEALRQAWRADDSRTTGVDVRAMLAALQSRVDALVASTSFKGAKDTAANLPPGAAPGDVWVTRDDGHLHVWTGTAYSDIGPLSGVDLADYARLDDIADLASQTDLDDYVLKDGDTLTGPLELADDPVGPYEAATKQYVDATAAAAAAVPSGTTPPTGPTAGQLWWDGTALKVWNGTVWATLDPRSLLKDLGASLRHDLPVAAITDTPPTGLTAADATRLWIVGSAPTGDFAGHVNEVAQWDGAAWLFAAASPDEARLVESDGQVHRFEAATTGAGAHPARWTVVHDTSVLPLTGGTVTGPLTVSGGLTVGTTRVRAAAPGGAGVGESAMRAATTAAGVLAAGRYTLSTCTRPDGVVAAGSSTLTGATTVDAAVAVGSSAAVLATSMTSAAAIGKTAAQNATTIGNSLIVGVNAARGTRTLTDVIAVGTSALAVSGPNLIPAGGGTVPLTAGNVYRCVTGTVTVAGTAIAPSADYVAKTGDTATGTAGANLIAYTAPAAAANILAVGDKATAVSGGFAFGPTADCTDKRYPVFEEARAIQAGTDHTVMVNQVKALAATIPTIAYTAPGTGATAEQTALASAVKALTDLKAALAAMTKAA